jgi:hypothetical protein
MPRLRSTWPSEAVTPTSSLTPSSSLATQPLREVRPSWRAKLFVRLVAFDREHDLAMLSAALIGLVIVSVLLGELTVARSCRDELRGRHDGIVEMRAFRHLACAFIDFAEGKSELASAAATDVLAGVELLGQPYAHVLGLELLAACSATDNPHPARELLVAADAERTAIGATAWPLEPYRHVAVRTLDALTRDPLSSPPA